MKKFLGLAFLSSLVFCMLCCKKEKGPLIRKVQNYHLEKVDSAIALAELFKTSIERDDKEEELRDLFLKTRLAYKKTEFFSEYYSPYTSKFINGAPIPEIDVDDQHRVTQPEGFQVIEPMIFPAYNKDNKAILLEEAEKLVSNLKRLKQMSNSNLTTNQNVFDAIKLEVFRIVTLGISGFDAPLSQNSIYESEVALSSVHDVLKIYKDSLSGVSAKEYQLCLEKVKLARNYLISNRNFNTFNRLEFITNYANPFSNSIVKLSIASGVGLPNDRRPLESQATSLFDPKAFNPDYYVSTSEARSTREKALLGKNLFFDPVMSGSATRSCASCHNPERAFTDGLDKSFAITKGKKVLRNTPTVLNSGLQPSLFYDLRVAYLEDQAADVINNKEEMHGSLAVAVQRLKKSDKYRELFSKAFPSSKDPVTEFTIKNSIGSYIRSLISLNSPFDKYVRGDKKQLNQNEINGFNLFMGKAKCGTCHFTPLFNGNVPPNFDRIESEVIGVPVSANKNQIDTDPGKYNLRHIEMHRNAFKTPTVRNIALTAPYMHNGIYKTLDEVVEFYNKGGGVGLGMVLENQTLPFDKLNLSEQEKKDIVAFLKKLTDTSAAQNVPRELPALGNSSKNRKVVYSY